MPIGVEAPDARRTLAVLILFYLINSLDRTILSLMVVPAKRDLLISDSQMGLLLGLGFALVYGFCGLPFGSIVDRASRRLVLFGGVMLWSCATAACALTHSFGELLVTRMMLGVGEAALMPAAVSILADKFPRDRIARAISIFVAGGLLGNGIAIGVGGVAISYFDRTPFYHLPLLGAIRGWQMPFLVVGVLGMCLAPLALTFAEPPRRQPASKETAALLPVLRSRTAILATFAGTFVFISMLFYISSLWVPTYVIRTFAWSPAQTGLWLGGINLLCSAGGTVVSGYVADRVVKAGYVDGYLRVFLGSVLIALPAGIAAFCVSSPIAFLILFAWFSFFGLAYSGYALASVQSVSPNRVRGRMSAIYMLTLIVIGAGGGPSIVGFLSDHAFGGTGKLGPALLLMFGVILPTVVVVAWLGLKALRIATLDTIRQDDTHALTP